MDMCFKNIVKTSTFLVCFALLGFVLSSCDVIETILPSAGNYKLNVQVNDILLDDCSFVLVSDKIHPFFEESVSGDQDITALMVFIRNSSGEILGRRVSYSLEHKDYSQSAADTTIPVKNLDETLPAFPMPNDLPKGTYLIVSQVMSGRSVLYRSEKQFYYLGATAFSYDGINVYLPGITENSHLIPRDTVIMLEANLDFDKGLDPYIVWYDGRRKIDEGKFSEGYGQLFWKAPERSGFFSLRAEVFPVEDFDGLAGYQKEISLLVSSMTMDLHLVSENVSQLVQWYTFEGSLNDSKMAASAERSIVDPAVRKKAKWKGINGTYGVVTGYDNAVQMPKVIVPKSNVKNWQAFFRLLPLNDGIIFSALFGHSGDVCLDLSKEGSNLILRLKSASNTVLQVYSLPVVSEESVMSAAAGSSAADAATAENLNPFLTAGVYFSITPGLLSARINIMGNHIDNEPAAKSISLNVDIDDEFRIVLGSLPENRTPEQMLAGVSTDESSDNLGLPAINENTDVSAKSDSVVLWDEFALYFMPPIEILIAELTPAVNKNDNSQNQ